MIPLPSLDSPEQKPEEAGAYPDESLIADKDDDEAAGKSLPLDKV